MRLMRFISRSLLNNVRVNHNRFLSEEPRYLCSNSNSGEKKVVEEKKYFSADRQEELELLDRHKFYQKKAKKNRVVEETGLIPQGFMEDFHDKNKETFMVAIEVFIKRDKHARGHVEFIRSALKFMKAFGVHKDLEAYKKLLDVFPKGKFIAQNMFQVEFMHYPKQQQCALDLLEQMEQNDVQPDSELEIQLNQIFGSKSFPRRKCARMLYWMTKFSNLSPWPLPKKLPNDSLELAKLAIQRMTCVDLKTKITIYNASDLEDSIDSTWIVSGQSPDQKELIETHPPNKPIYVEGAFRVWLNLYCVNYFILRGEPRILPKKPERQELDDVGDIKTLFEEEFVEESLAKRSVVHEQEDGIIYAICATGSSSKDSILSWIRFLSEENPRIMKDIPILFTLKSPIGPTDDLEILTPIETQKRKDQALGIETFGLNYADPSLDQIGISKRSETRFVNWPHHHRPPSPQTQSQEEEPEVDPLNENLENKKIESP